MNAEREAKSHTTVWTLSILTLPLLYLLSVPPIGVSEYRTRPGTWCPQWYDTYRAPYNWALENTPLAMPLQNYSTWWWGEVVIHIDATQSETSY